MYTSKFLLIFNYLPNQLRRIIRSIYGLSDVPDYLQSTVVWYLKSDFKMTPVSRDLPLYIKHAKNSLSGIIATHLHDILGAGAETPSNLNKIGWEVQIE